MCVLENKDFNEIAAGLAHEVKNPVALIKANVDLIQSDIKTQEYNKNFSIIKRELDKITYIVSDFIQLSKPIDEQNKEEIFIFDLLSDIIEDYDISLKGRDIKINIDCENEDLFVYGDYPKLCILFYNIFKNAVEAIQGKGEINVLIYSYKNQIVTQIRDNGVGLDDELKDKIFQPFITTKKCGSGLGLSICKNIVDQHNGEFKIENADGGGCVVTVIL